MQLRDTLDSYLRKVEEFHGRSAPGLVIGCYMVDYAAELLGDPRGKLGAVTETQVCLADSVQVMTGCTLGNKDLRIQMHIGRYACALYDRATMEGVRVYLDLDKIDRARYPELHAFHIRQRDPRCHTDPAFRQASGRRVVEEFLKLKREALSYERIRITLPAKDEVLPSVRCIRCREPFVTSAAPDEAVCDPCSGRSYYSKI